MRAIGIFVIAILISTAGARGSEAPRKGAKELFFDPAGNRTTSASPPSAAPAVPPVPSAPGTPPRPAPGKPGLPVTSTRHPKTVQVARKELPQPLGLSYWIELETPQGTPAQRVTHQRVFQSGDRIRLHFRSNAGGHIALLQVGSHGGSSLLFPDAAQGLPDSSIPANQDRVLPGEAHWFRFDEQPGTERLVVVFARSQGEVESLPIRPTMDPTATVAVLNTARGMRGSKDLIIETDTATPTQIGTYGVTLSGKPVILEIDLMHQ